MAKFEKLRLFVNVHRLRLRSAAATQIRLAVIGPERAAHTFSGSNANNDLKPLIDSFCNVLNLQQLIRSQRLADTGEALNVNMPAADVAREPTKNELTRHKRYLTATRVAATVAAGVGGFGLVSGTLMSVSYFCIPWAIAPFLFYAAPVVGLAVGASCARIAGGATLGASAAAVTYLTRLAAAERALWAASMGALAFGIVGATGCALWHVALPTRSYVAFAGAVAGACLCTVWEGCHSTRVQAVDATPATG